MRRPSREINVLSISALDLFCSSMGAFIVIALMMLPFFPNTSTAAKSDAPSLPQTDVVILIDTSASMEKEIEGLKSEVADLAHVLKQLKGDVRVGMVDFDDRCASPELRSFDLTPMTEASIQDLKTFSDGMQAGMVCSPENSDQPEALYEAMVKADGMAWRASAKTRYIIAISDNAVYPEERQQAFDLASRFHDGGGRISVMFRRYGPENAPDAEATLKTIAERGGGAFTDLNGRSFGMQVLMAMTE